GQTPPRERWPTRAVGAWRWKIRRRPLVARVVGVEAERREGRHAGREDGPVDRVGAAGRLPRDIGSGAAVGHPYGNARAVGEQADPGRAAVAPAFEARLG